MANLNKVFLMGNLTRNPELRYTRGGVAVCEIGMAVNRKSKDRNGTEYNDACFVDVVVWDKVAESCTRHLEKGSALFIEGRLIFEQWEDRNGGGKRSRLRVNAERVQFIGRPSSVPAEESCGGGGEEHRYPQSDMSLPQVPPEGAPGNDPNDIEDEIPF